jgi:hypothetical protein
MPRPALDESNSLAPRSCQDDALTGRSSRTIFMVKPIVMKSICWSDPHVSVSVECFVAGVFLASRTYQFLLIEIWRGDYDIQMIRHASTLVPCLSLSATFEFLSRFGDRTADLVSLSGDRHLRSVAHSGDVALILLMGLIVQGFSTSGL